MGKSGQCAVAASGKEVCVNTLTLEPLLCDFKEPLSFGNKEIQGWFDQWKAEHHPAEAKVCPVTYALYLHHEFERTLVAALQTLNENAERLRAVEFTHRMCLKYQERQTKESVWKDNIFEDQIKDDGKALSGDLKHIRKLMKDSKDAINSAHKPVVAVLKDSSFLKHLKENHTVYSMGKERAILYYGVDATNGYDFFEGMRHADFKLPDDYLTGKAYFREIDHFIDLLTRNLAASEVGSDFLTDLTGSDKILSTEAFKTFAGYLKDLQGDLIPATLGRNVYNLFESAPNKILHAIANGARTVDEVRKATGRTLQNLEEMTKANLDTIVKGSSENFNKVYAQLRKKGVSEKQLRELKLARFSKRLESNAWIPMCLQTVGFVVSGAQLFDAYKSDIKNNKWNFVKAHLDFISSGAGWVGTSTKLMESQIGKWGITSTEDIARLSTIGKVTGAVAGTLGAIVSFGDSYVATQKGDSVEGGLQFVSGGISAVGTVGLIVGATTLWPLTLAGILIGLAIAAVKKNAMEEWVSLGPWGKNHDSAQPPYKYGVKDVVARYFTTVENPAKILEPNLMDRNVQPGWFRYNTFYQGKATDTGIVRIGQPGSVILSIKSRDADGCFLQAVLEGKRGRSESPRFPVTNDLTTFSVNLPHRPPDLNDDEPDEVNVQVSLHLPEEHQGLELDKKEVELPVWES